MNHVCDKQLPCGQHITVFIWILGLMCAAITSSVYATVDNRNKAVEEHKYMIEVRSKDDTLLRAEMSKNYAEIIQRLARIEGKVSN
jgi:hypothetical protein